MFYRQISESRKYSAALKLSNLPVIAHICTVLFSLTVCIKPDKPAVLY